MFKVGDKIRVKSGSALHGRFDPSQELAVYSVISGKDANMTPLNNETAEYLLLGCTTSLYLTYFSGSYFELISRNEALKDSLTQNKHTCKCESKDLFLHGCRCKGI